MMQLLKVILADTYALYLKTQNYHWHVKGPNFKSLHELFEMQYRELAEAVDGLAERLLILGGVAPATFKELNQLKTLKDGDSHYSADKMVADLAQDHKTLVSEMHKILKLASDNYDEGTVAILSERISSHEKSAWMLGASQKA